MLNTLQKGKLRFPVHNESSTREFRNYLYLLPVSFGKKAYCISFYLIDFSFHISITINATIANDATLSTDMTTMVSLLLRNMTVQNQIRTFFCYLKNHEKLHWK